jgi:hypothetical protein
VVQPEDVAAGRRFQAEVATLDVAVDALKCLCHFANFATPLAKYSGILTT